MVAYDNFVMGIAYYTSGKLIAGFVKNSKNKLYKIVFIFSNSNIHLLSKRSLKSN